MKKFLCWTLSLLMISTLFFTISCSSQDEEVFDMDFRTDYEIDLTGQTYKWGTNWPEQILLESGFSEGGDMILKRLSALKEKYGCTFEVIKWENGTGRIFQEVAAGYYTVNFLDSDISRSGLPLYKANMLYALEDIPNIDMSDNKFGNPRLLQDGTLDGKTYGFFPYAWEIIPEYSGVMHFNAEMLSSLGVNSPHELRENGLWDWANFKEYLLSIQESAANVGYDDDFIPIIGSSYANNVIGFMFANGLNMIEGSKGNYTFGFDNANGMAAIEFLADLYNEGLYEQRGDAEFVKNKKSALMAHESYFSTHYYQGGASGAYLPSQDYVYGMIRYPHGPNGDANSVSASTSTHRRNMILSTSGHDIEDIGTVMNYVFAPLDDPKGWSGLLKDQIFYHKEDHYEYVYMIENINYNYNSVYLESGYDTWFADLNAAVMGQKSVSEVFSSTRSIIQEAIDKNVTWTYDELAD